MTVTYIRARSGVNVLITPSSTVRDRRLSFRAVGVLSRLLDNAEGYGMTAEQLAAEGRGREGRDAVRTALRELQACGYIVRAAKMTAAGRFAGCTLMVYDTPIDRGPENPHADFQPPESQGHKSSKSTNRSTNINSSSMRARAPAGGAAAAGKKETKKVRRVRPSGLVTWTDDDLQNAANVESDTTPDELQAGVADVLESGKEPLPGLVARAIQLARIERAKVELAKAHEESGPLAEARRRAAKRKLRDADPAQRRAGANAISNIAAMLTASAGLACDA